jgi:type VI secretion system secreted protein Hcp
MADTYFFLKLDGIDGESQDTDHSGEIDVMSFSEGITNAGSYDSGTGGNTGQAYYADLNLTKYVDKASPTLRQYCGLGTAIDKAVISCNKQAGDKKVEYLKVTLHNVVITSIQGSGSGGSTDPIMESLSLNFAGIEYDYTQQSNTGDALGTTHFGRDIQQNSNI